MQACEAVAKAAMEAAKKRIVVRCRASGKGLRMTPEERQLLIAAAQALLQCARWGQNTGIDQEVRNALSAALAAVQHHPVQK